MINRLLVMLQGVCVGAFVAVLIFVLADGDSTAAHAVVTPASVSVPTNSTPMFCTATACYHVNPDGSLGQQAP